MNHQVSKAELLVLDLLPQGYSNAEMADKIGISEKTVKFHLTNIYSKYGVRSRAELVAQLSGFQKTEREIIMSGITKIEDKKALTQSEKVDFINDKFKVGEVVEHLHTMMKDVTKEQMNPATVNAACNVVARLNETINTAITAARFLNER